MRVVVGVDGSPGGVAALRWALELCEGRHEPTDLVELVHVHGAHELAMPLFVPSSVAAPGRYGELAPRMAVAQEAGTVTHRAELQEHFRHEAEALLSNALQQAGGPRRTRVELDAAAGSEPGAALVARSDAADLLVVGARGQSRLREVLLGSVATYCVHHARCPVVVVPSPPG